MKIDVIKSEIKHVSIICFSVLLIVALIMAGAIWYKGNNYDVFDDIKRQIVKYKGKEVEIESQIKEFKESLILYKKMTEDDLPSVRGYSSTADRIRAFTPVVSKLKSSYKFANISPSFENVLKYKDKNLKFTNIAIYNNNFTITFDAISDEVVFSTIKSLIDYLPGYVVIKSVGIKNIYDRYDGNIFDHLKDTPYTVQGTAAFSWKTLKLLSTDNTK